jgi:hypothetical protein
MSNTVTMVCDRRAQPDAPCRLSVSTTGEPTLVVITSWGTVEKRLSRGDHELVVK